MEKPPHGIKSVSYTHLDVYKRQTKHTTEETLWLPDPRQPHAKTLRGVALRVLIHPAKSISPSMHYDVIIIGAGYSGCLLYTSRCV